MQLESFSSSEVIILAMSASAEQISSQLDQSFIRVYLHFLSFLVKIVWLLNAQTIFHVRLSNNSVGKRKNVFIYIKQKLTWEMRSFIKFCSQMSEVIT